MEINNMPKIKKFMEVPGVNVPILNKLGANPKSVEGLEKY